MKEPGRYRKKPIVVEAMRFANGEQNAVAHWCGGRVEVVWNREMTQSVPVVLIDTLEGTMQADVGDYVVREPTPTPDRQFYPVKPSIFDATYEEVE